MHLSSIFLLGFCLAASSTAAVAPSTNSSGVCRNPPKRLEWYATYPSIRHLSDVACRRQLSEPQKKSYIDAVLCLTKKNAISGIANALNRFDDHEAVHSSQTPDIHWVGHFILWHRYFVATYEKALRDECGYLGGQPYVQRIFGLIDCSVIDLLAGIGIGRRTRSLEITTPQRSLSLAFLILTLALAAMATMLSPLQSRILSTSLVVREADVCRLAPSRRLTSCSTTRREIASGGTSIPGS